MRFSPFTLGVSLGTLLTAALTPDAAQAQRRMSITVSLGQFQYDAGDDQWYSPLVRLDIARRIAPGLSIGVGGSRAEIGRIKHWFAFPTDETIWRAFASVEGNLDRPFKSHGVPLFDRLSFGIGANAGMVASSGVTLQPTVVQDPFVSISNDSRGFAWGGGASVSLYLVQNLSLLAAMRYWRDDLFGGHLDDFEQTIGMTLSW
jgi:opacity protein-like surface antigen